MLLSFLLWICLIFLFLYRKRLFQLRFRKFFYRNCTWLFQKLIHCQFEFLCWFLTFHFFLSPRFYFSSFFFFLEFSVRMLLLVKAVWMLVFVRAVGVLCKWNPTSCVRVQKWFTDMNPMRFIQFGSLSEMWLARTRDKVRWRFPGGPCVTIDPLISPFPID